MGAARLSRLVRTVSHLRPSQIGWRLWRRLRKSRPVPPDQVPDWRPTRGQWTQPVAKPSPYLGDYRFIFLNEEGAIAPGDWRAEERSALWRYNLHYFDLCASPADPAEIAALIDDWIDANPAGTTVAFDAYPISLRLVNWAKFQLADWNGDATARRSMAHQARWLAANLEYHILANHLFANAKGLLFAGALIDGEEADRWWQNGRDLALREVDEQFLADGAHYERTPMYHSILTEDLLDIINIAKWKGDRALRDAIAPKAQAALGWLANMTHPDGGISFFNDAAFGIAPDARELGDYAQRLGLGAGVTQQQGWLGESGYGRLSDEANVVLVDGAPLGPDYQPGHGHADTLSFEWSHKGQRVVVNSGTSEYGEGPQRHRQRSTCAHSTLELAGENSSEVWAGFRVGRRARVDTRTLDSDRQLIASHDGYRFLPGKPGHQRSWTLGKQALVIADTVRSKGALPAKIIFHLHPEVQARQQDRAVHLQLSDGSRIVAEADWPVHVEPGEWHPEFGRTVPNQRLVIDWPGESGELCETRFSWSER